MGEPGTERFGAEGNEIVVEVTVLGSNDGGEDTRPCAAPGEAFCGARALSVVVTGNDDARDTGRRCERA